MSHFGCLLREHLHKRGWTYRDAEERLGVSNSYISNICNGKKSLKPDRLDEWADTLNLQDQERLTFMLFGYIAHAPQAETWANNLLNRIQDLETNITLLIDLIQDTNPNTINELQQQAKVCATKHQTQTGAE